MSARTSIVILLEYVNKVTVLIISQLQLDALFTLPIHFIRQS